MAQKLGKTVGELLRTVTQAELLMWDIYYSVPKEEEKLSLQVAQLTSVLANVNGNKTTTKDFIFDFSQEKEEIKKETMEEKVKKFSEQIKKDMARL